MVLDPNDIETQEANRQGALIPTNSEASFGRGVQNVTNSRPQSDRSSQKPLAKFLRGLFDNVPTPSGRINTVPEDAPRPTTGFQRFVADRVVSRNNIDTTVTTDIDEATRLLEIMNEASGEMQEVSDFFTFLELANNDHLSPETKMQLDNLSANYIRKIGRINDSIEGAAFSVEAYDRIFQEQAGRDADTVNQAKGMLGASGSQGAGVGGTASGPGSNVRNRASDRMSEAVGEIMNETTGQSGGFNIVPGGVETPGHQARQQRSVEESMITLENSLDDTSGLSEGGGDDQLTSSQQSAIDQAANAQLDYLGVASEGERMKAEAAFKFAMSAEVVNMVREREDIKAEYDQSVAAIQLDAMQAMDENYLGFTPDPHFEGITAGQDYAKRRLDNMGVDLGFQEEAFADYIRTYIENPAAEGQVIAALKQAIPDLADADDAELSNILRAAENQASSRLRSMTNFDNRVYQSGTPEMAALINAAASQAGVDPALAEELMNKHTMHQLIKVRSGGNPNAKRGANMRGLLGLPEDVYERAGYSWDEIKNDPVTQLAVGINYIRAQYGGDPAAALQDLIENEGLNFDGFRKVQGPGATPPSPTDNIDMSNVPTNQEELDDQRFNSLFGGS